MRYVVSGKGHSAKGKLGGVEVVEGKPVGGCVKAPTQLAARHSAVGQNPSCLNSEIQSRFSCIEHKICDIQRVVLKVEYSCPY